MSSDTEPQTPISSYDLVLLHRVPESYQVQVTTTRMLKVTDFRYCTNSLSHTIKYDVIVCRGFIVSELSCFK